MRPAYRGLSIRRTHLPAIVAAMFALCAAPVCAHVGSPDVFLEGDAGPYHLFATVRMPQVIPGVADIEVRSQSDEVREIRTTVTTLSGAGAKYAPVPDVAERSKRDPRFFTSSLWLMENGSLQVRLLVDGSRGKAEMAVPVAAFAQRTFAMPRWLGAILLTLTIILAAGAVAIVGAAARESVLEPGAAPTPEYRRRGMRAMAVTAAIALAVFYLAFVWWSADARSYEAAVKFFKPPKIDAALQGGNRLVLKNAEDMKWRDYEVKMADMIPDHGHLMHLFLIGTPRLDRIWHLHPERMSEGKFVEDLPSIDGGHYRMFADLVHKSGFPFTMVGEIDLPEVSGGPLSGDDSAGSAAPIGDVATGPAVFELPHGGRVVWQQDSKPLQSGAPIFLRFEIQDGAGKPAGDLTPYMGMAAHAEIVRSDLSVFAHVHPSGSVPMVSLMMAQTHANGAAASSPMTGMAMSGEKVSPEISIPYGFPKPGDYRIFLQFRRSDRIENAVFDARVE